MDRNLLPRMLSVLLFGMALPAGILSAQTGTSSAPPDETALEKILEAYDEELDQETADILANYRLQPLLLRSATVAELASIPGISPQLAGRIRLFMQDSTASTYDRLAAIEGLDPQLLDLLRIYTSLEEPGQSHHSRQPGLQFRSRISTDIQERRGYREQLYQIIPNATAGQDTDTVPLGPRFRGTPIAVFSRILASYGRFSGGLTFEKDPGEVLFYRDTLNFTYENFEQRRSNVPLQIRSGLGAFLSFHVRAELTPATIVVGDYRAEFGQGLLFGNRFAGRKGGVPTRDPYRTGSGIRPYTSGSETGYLRGTGITLHPGIWMPSWLETDLFLSRRLLDASIQEKETRTSRGDTILRIGTIREDGLLQTHGDIRRDDRVREELVGARLKGLFGRSTLELTGYAQSRDILTGTTSTPTEGETVSGVSLAATSELGAGRIFGELAFSNATLGKGFAGSVGLALDLAGTDLTLCGRYYAPDFLSPHGTGFGEDPSDPGNEAGMYAGLRSRLFPRTFLSVYGDIYRFPQGTPAFPFQLNGIDGMLLLEYGITPELDLSLRIRSESRDDKTKTVDETGRDRTVLLDRNIRSVRFNAAWKSQKGMVETRFRIERKWASYSDLVPTVSGNLAWIDLRWDILPTLSCATRLALFRAPETDVRLYAFEQDLPGKISIPALSGEGRRLYGLLRWKPAEDLTLTARYAETWYADRTTISEGSLREITGSTTGTVSLQIDWER